MVHRGVHPHPFPNVPIGILQASGVHHPVVLKGVGIRFATSLRPTCYDLINGRFAGSRQAQQHLGTGAGIRNEAGCKLPPFGMGQQHHINGIRTHHTGRRFIRKGGVLAKSNGTIKMDRLCQIVDWQIDKNHLGGYHDSCS